MCSTEGRCPLLEHKSILSHLSSSLSTLDYPRYQVHPMDTATTLRDEARATAGASMYLFW